MEAAGALGIPVASPACRNVVPLTGLQDDLASADAFGIYRAIVRRDRDPLAAGRLRIAIPEMMQRANW